MLKPRVLLQPGVRLYNYEGTCLLHHVILEIGFVGKRVFLVYDMSTFRILFAQHKIVLDIVSLHAVSYSVKEILRERSSRMVI